MSQCFQSSSFAWGFCSADCADSTLELFSLDYVCGLLRQLREYLQLAYLGWWRRRICLPSGYCRGCGLNSLYTMYICEKDFHAFLRWYKSTQYMPLIILRKMQQEITDHFYCTFLIYNGFILTAILC